ncbi:hypothetical protein XENOCAPTIV_004995 [Xenoophorus captivus]|uniref:PH domain-containing protein n=1 Tax=Xenoophorus captivus TaxID=1517983 RepID=A0ABV0RY24_9TELE
MWVNGQGSTTLVFTADTTEIYSLFLKWQRRFFVLYEHGCLRFALDESALMNETVLKIMLFIKQQFSLQSLLSSKGLFVMLCLLQPSTLPQGTVNMNLCTDVVDAEPKTGQKNSLCIITPEQEYFIRGENKEIING